jgi:pyruvate,water dikinase
MTMLAPARLLRLSDEGGDDAEAVGGKAARLADLRRRGFAVPEGLVVGPRDPLDPDALAAGLADLASGPDARFAVRSSALLEDLAGASFAGQYLTLLDVSASEVPDAVQRVRASVASRTATAYQSGRDDGRSGAMAVLIQPMIRAAAAGVAFTADPVSGDRTTTVVTATPGLGDRLVSGEADAETWDVHAGVARPREPSTAALEPGLIGAVADLAARVAAIDGVPQDIEWAHDGERLWLLQARPITALAPAVDWTSPARGAFMRSLRFGEWIPEPVTPLFESWLLPAMERRLHELHRQWAGIVAPEPLHVIVNGWYFYSINFAPVTLRAVARSGPHILVKLIRQARRVAMVFPPTARFGARLFEREWREDLLPRYLRETDAAGARVESASPAELVAMIDELATLAGEYFASIAVVAGYAYKAELLFARFFSRHLARTVEGGHLVLLSGLAPPEPAPPHAVSSLDWSRPTLGELDQGASRSADPAAGRHDTIVERRDAAERTARAALEKSGRRRRSFDTLLAEAQRAGRIREEQVAQLTRSWPVMRRAVMRLGETLVADGALRTPGDAFFLQRDELAAAIDGHPIPGLIEQPVLRRAAWAAAARLQPPATVGTMPRLFGLMERATGKLLGVDPRATAIVRGVPASPGRATGRVRVIRDPDRGHELQAGEILVAPLTAPAWTPMFERAAAVVTDVGSALAHASIIAREYGIPAVVGCGDATFRLRDGQLVTVDGARGIVIDAAPGDQPD